LTITPEPAALECNKEGSALSTYTSLEGEFGGRLIFWQFDYDGFEVDEWTNTWDFEPLIRHQTLSKAKPTEE
jgi:hypothetical protein